jgi:hypothetical protein
METPTLSLIIAELAKALGDRDAARARLIEAQQRVVLYEAHPLFQEYATALCGISSDILEMVCPPEAAVGTVIMRPPSPNGHADPG